MTDLERVLRLAAAYALMDTEVQQCIAVALRLPLVQVLEVSESLADQAQLLDDMANAFVEGGGVEQTLEEMLAELEDPDPNATTNRHAEQRQELIDTYKYDYFGDDER